MKYSLQLAILNMCVSVHASEHFRTLSYIISSSITPMSYNIITVPTLLWFLKTNEISKIQRTHDEANKWRSHI